MQDVLDSTIVHLLALVGQCSPPVHMGVSFCLPSLPPSPPSPPQTLPVAPLYGDVQIRFADWVRQLTHYDPSKWTCTSEHTEEKATVGIQTIQIRFIAIMARPVND